jgi:hypothetical protein
MLNLNSGVLKTGLRQLVAAKFAYKISSFFFFFLLSLAEGFEFSYCTVGFRNTRKIFEESIKFFEGAKLSPNFLQPSLV